MSIVFFAAGFLVLSVLAVLNARQIRVDGNAINGDAEALDRYFRDSELRRAWMRASGWLTFFIALVVRINMDEGLLRTKIVVVVILFGIGIFITEALEGRRERKTMMRDATISEKIDTASSSAENHYASFEIEKHRVRERLDEADYVRKVELDAAADRLHEKLEEIKRLLQRGR